MFIPTTAMLGRRQCLSSNAAGAHPLLWGHLLCARPSIRLLTHTASPWPTSKQPSPPAAASALAQPQHQQHTDRQPVATKVFKFRHFTLLHGGPCAMQMGTDAMLLGAWAQPPPHTASVLDGKWRATTAVAGRSDKSMYA